MSLEKQLIRMDEGRGVLVEVEVDRAVAVQAASLGEIVDVRKSFEAVSDLLHQLLLPFVQTWRELSREVELSEATVKLAIGVTASGNFFLAKGESSANLEVEVKFKPVEGKP